MTNPVCEVCLDPSSSPAIRCVDGAFRCWDCCLDEGYDPITGLIDTSNNDDFADEVDPPYYC